MASTLQKYGVLNGVPLPEYDDKDLKASVLHLGEGTTKELAVVAQRRMREKVGYHPFFNNLLPADPKQGVNLYTRFAVADVVEGEDARIRLATPAILEKAIAEALRGITGALRDITGALRGITGADHRFVNYLSDFGEAFALAVFGEPYPNEHLRRHLLPQLRERDLDPKEAPVVIYRAKVIRGEFPDGIGFDLGDEPNVAFYAPCLLEPSFMFGNNPTLVESGLPGKSRAELGDVARTLHTPNEKTGLRRIVRLPNSLDIHADSDRIEVPTEYGRISVLVSSTPQELEALAKSEGGVNDRFNDTFRFLY